MESVLNKFEAYLLTEKHVAHNTYQAYMHDIEQCIGFARSKNKKIDEIDKATLKDFLLHLKKNNVSAQTLARKISSLKLFFGWVHNQYGWPSIADDLIFPKLDKKLPNYLSEQEIQELLQAAHKDCSDNGKRNLVMLYLLYSAGLRITELTTLKFSDFNIDTGVITLFGKGNKQRVVPLPTNIMDMVQDYKEKIHSKFTREHGLTEYLFPTIYAGIIKPISRQAYWNILKQLCAKTTIKRPVSPHVLRHSLATHLLKNGAHLRSLQLLLGHENLSTVQIYTHVEMSHLRKLYNKKHPRS
jgi:integrase/recombinase XerD